MSRIVLESICDQLPSGMPEFFKHLDTETFGPLNLYRHQEEALRNALNAIYLYFYKKQDLIHNYKTFDNSQYQDLCITNNHPNFDILSNYYEVKKQKIDFSEFINRASFWMATGSGKTLVIIKMMELIYHLANNNFIPKNDILFLAPKPRIIKQIKEHIDIFNKNGNLKIILKDVREWENVKFQQPDLYAPNTITVFYYRSDNITDVDKTKKIDYETILNNGEWYILLDEAHKGDSEDSIRQQYYTILSQNGFLFNFSATFVDLIDIATTAYNFNLEKFITSGFGKHIRISNEQYLDFKVRNEGDFTDSEKYQIVLKSCILYATIKKHAEKIRKINPALYHNPLMVTLANTVKTISADLKLFFVQLAKIASNNYVLNSARDELVFDLQHNRNFQYRTGEIPQSLITETKIITKEEILKYIFHANSPGKIEWTKIVDNPKEIAFRLKTAEEGKHFGLLHASNAISWGENILADYEFNTTPIRESFFDEIKKNDSEINILLGSRIFSEGWDINRPNVINLINIGVDAEAQKFVLQAIGRGVRIEPINKIRKRINYFTPDDNEVLNSHINGEEHLKIIRNHWNTSIESLHIFATSKDVISNITQNLNRASSNKYWTNVISIKKNEDISKDLIFASYEISDKDIPSYRLSNKEYSELFSYIGNERNKNDKLILMECPENALKTLINTLKIIRHENQVMSNGAVKNATAFDNLLLLNKHFHQKPKEIKSFKKITNEIIHYKNVQVANLESQEIEELEKLIQIKCEKPRFETREKLIEALQYREISPDEFDSEDNKLKQSNDFSSRDLSLIINNKFLKEHYYTPIIISHPTSRQYVKHVIDIQSEIDFLNDLYEHKELLEKYDWWYFSKIDQNLDMVSIPYYNNEEQNYNKFFPDFIFWLKKDNIYFIKFIDPKGRIINQQNAFDKAMGYEEIFKEKDFYYSNSIIKTDLFFYNEPVHLPELSDYYTNDFIRMFRD